MTLSENIITVLVLLILSTIGYCKYTNKTLPEFAREIKEIFSSEPIESAGGLNK